MMVYRSAYRVEALPTVPHATIVGWDDFLQTFFAEVWDRVQDVGAKDVGDDEGCVVWANVQVCCVPTVTALEQAIAAYAVLPADIAAALEYDQGASEPRAPLQKWVRWVRSAWLSRLRRPGGGGRRGSEHACTATRI